MINLHLMQTVHHDDKRVGLILCCNFARGNFAVKLACTRTSNELVRKSLQTKCGAHRQAEHRLPFSDLPYGHFFDFLIVSTTVVDGRR